jgi:hypothetical protein
LFTKAIWILFYFFTQSLHLHIYLHHGLILAKICEKQEQIPSLTCEGPLLYCSRKQNKGPRDLIQNLWESTDILERTVFWSIPIHIVTHVGIKLVILTHVVQLIKSLGGPIRSHGFSLFCLMVIQNTTSPRLSILEADSR